MSVAPRPIKCGAALPDGGECQEYATVTNAQYVYDRTLLSDGGTDYALKEIHYEAICPRCGDRKLVESP